MTAVYGPTPATERDVTFAWRGAEAAIDAAVADPEDEGAQRSAAATFGGFIAASRSAARAVAGVDAEQRAAMGPGSVMTEPAERCGYPEAEREAGQ